MRKSKAIEAFRVAQEVDVIRTALRKRGYHIRKRPKQAAWIIYATQENFYILTYQPAPISSWVLYPQNSTNELQMSCSSAVLPPSRDTHETERHRIESIIQRALIKQSTPVARKVS
jgi:hypothetical protein